MIGALPDGFELRRAWASGWYKVDKLIDGLAWEQRTVTAFGRTYACPRLTAWYGEAAYSYSGTTHPPAELPPLLESIRERVQNTTGRRFNSVLANYYRDGSDSVAWHADDEVELGEQPTIASLSIGAPRRFSVKSRRANPAHRTDLWLCDGDLLVMSGRSQLDYLHSVPKTSRPVGPRINLTFRWVRV